MVDTLKIIRPEPATTHMETPDTEVGSVFVSNYPPYSFWTADSAGEALKALNSPALPDATLGLYLHIPFCRKRCKFCYFRVYTDKNSDEIQSYLTALSQEIALYSKLPSIRGRRLKFVYFGGGTPSYISAKHLQELVTDLKQSISWEGAEEITFECEPGTLTEAKLDVIRDIGVTRLSLGIENFDDNILEINGRAHHSREIFRTIPWIRERGFQQLNIDLIAGMLGENWNAWRETVSKTIEADPDSITVYQMELPYNTVFSGDLMTGTLQDGVADWQTKREWHAYAFEEFAKAGYKISSAYTMIKADKPGDFVYRNAVWHGSDMIGSGVASFGHMSGVHIQNNAGWDSYMAPLREGRLPLDRAFVTSKEERLTREVILQLKMGQIDARYFQQKFGANIIEFFADALGTLKNQGYLEVHGTTVRLTPKGFLKVDHLLPEFYHPRYRNARYT